MGPGPETRNGQLRGPDLDLIELNGMLDWIGRAGEFTPEERTRLTNQLSDNPGVRRRSSILLRSIRAELGRDALDYMDRTLRSTEVIPPNIPLEREIFSVLQGAKHERQLDYFRRMLRTTMST